jgi:hypothetical protein
VSEVNDLQRRAGRILLGGTHPLYSAAATLRADDLAVRSHANSMLGDLAERLDQAVRAMPLPVPTRDSPATDALEARRRVRAVERRVRDEVDAVTALPAPIADSAHRRAGQEETEMLHRLLACDVVLLECLEVLAQAEVRDLEALGRVLDEVERLLAHRRTLVL